MSFREEHYATLRPFLYHLTNRHNIERVRRTRKLQSTAALLTLAKQAGFLRRRRSEPLPIEVNRERVILCDQAPLRAGNAQLTSGWSFPHFIEHLNHYVFFWSGWARGPVTYGVRYFERYSAERPIVLRARFQSVRKKNPTAEPLFCKYNSGSPRWSNGRPSPRGPETFSPAQTTCFNSGEVVEVVFHGSVTLPDDTEYARSVTGPWCSL